MFGSINWTWLIVGFLAAMFGYPMVMGFIARRRTPAAA